MEETRMRVFLFAALMILLLFALAFGAMKKVPTGVEFSYDDPSAFSVALAGTFNNWDTQSLAMTKDEEGTWRVVVSLTPGRYEYKFVVNGSNWTADPDNPKVVGDYGNSEIEIDENGEPVIRGLTTIISNTPANSRVLITGWFRGTYSLRKDALGDVRWRGSRPEHEMYVSVNPTIGSDVKGSATLRIDSGEGDIREVTADLYSARLAYTSHYFDATAYHNQEIIQFDDPLGILGHRDLPGTLWDDDVAFGKGTQGIIGDFRFMGLGTRAFYANTFDADIYDSDVWYNFDGTTFQAASRYDNTGTDNIGVRAERGFLGINVGGTYLSERNGWWVGFETQEPPSAILEYRIESRDSASTWFEMGTEQRSISVDAEMKPTRQLSLSGEYAWTRYDAKWDAGNRVRKQGDVFVDGKVDIPVGSEDGSRYMVGLDFSKGDLDTKLSFESDSYDGMKSSESYVSNFGYPFEDADTPLLPLYGPALLEYRDYVNTYTSVNSIETFVIFEYPGLPERTVRRGRLEVAGRALGLSLGLSLDVAKREWDFRDGHLSHSELTQVSVLPSVAGDVFGERLSYKVMYEDSKDNLHPRMPSAYGRNTLLVSGDLGLVDHWQLYCNLRRVSYDWKEGHTTRSDAFFDTNVALVWSPIPHVEIRLGYGVNPIYYRDQAVEGREIGRERWTTSYLWLSPENSLIDAEKALEKVDMISLMGVIAF
jgi:hypothetical protein